VYSSEQCGLLVCSHVGLQPLDAMQQKRELPQLQMGMPAAYCISNLLHMQLNSALMWLTQVV
jgi:hypothetical protein